MTKYLFQFLPEITVVYNKYIAISFIYMHDTPTLFQP